MKNTAREVVRHAEEEGATLHHKEERATQKKTSSRMRSARRRAGKRDGSTKGEYHSKRKSTHDSQLNAEGARCRRARRKGDVKEDQFREERATLKKTCSERRAATDVGRWPSDKTTRNKSVCS